MHGKYKKILIINRFGIGDLLFSTPMIRALKAWNPEACIDVMCNERGRHVLQHNKNISDIIVFEKDVFRVAYRASKPFFIKKIFQFVKQIKVKKYDLAIDLSLGYKMSLFLKILGVKKRIGFNYRNRGKFLTEKVDMHGFNDKHVIEYYLDLLRLFGIGDFVRKNLELPLSTELCAWGENFIREKGIENKKIIGIAPGGGRSWGRYAIYRRWDPENFAYVAKKLSEKNNETFFLILGSKREMDISYAIEKSLAGRALNLCGELALPNSIALIKKCKLILCNDGGILHIGVSQGVNTVSIFGPVNDKVYGPYPSSNKHKVVKAESVPCRPCYKNFKHKTCRTHDCLKKIDRDEVLKLAEESLEV